MAEDRFTKPKFWEHFVVFFEGKKLQKTEFTEFTKSDFPGLMCSEQGKGRVRKFAQDICGL